MAGRSATPRSKSSSIRIRFYHYWYPHRDYPWYYDDLEQQRVAPLLRRSGPGHQTRNDQDRRDRQSHAHVRYAARKLQSGFRVSHRSARHRFIAPRDHRQRHRARHAPALLRLPARAAKHLSPERQSHRRHQSARRERTTGDDRRHRQSHARLLVGSLARSQRPRSERRRAAPAARKVRRRVSAASNQRTETVAAEVSRLPARRHPDADGEDRRRRRRRNCSSLPNAKATIALPGKVRRLRH